MSTNVSTSKGIILPPHIISQMAKAQRPADAMGPGEWAAGADILGKGWKPFRLEPDTAALWDFTRSRGDPLADLSPNGNDLTLSGDVLRAADGPFGWSYDFPGTDDYLITSGNPASLQITGELTVEAIYKADVIGSKAVASKWDEGDNNRSWQLFYGSTFLGFAMSSAGTSQNAIAAVDDAIAPTGTVFYAAGIFKPSSYVRLIVNGCMVAEDITSIPASIYNCNQNITIGANWSTTTPTYDFDGHIMCVRITGRSKSLSELYRAGARFY